MSETANPASILLKYRLPLIGYDHLLLKIGWIFCAMIPSLGLLGQFKYEKEYRIKPTEVPQEALDWVQSLPIETKVKWYLEEGLENKTVEAKTKWQSRKTSIEFSQLGVLEDVEIETKRKELPASSQQAIEETLDGSFSRWKCKKIQIQYSGEPDEVKQLFLMPSPPASLLVRFELIVKGKLDDRTLWYEVLLSDQGEWLQSKQIVFKNTEHLEY